MVVTGEHFRSSRSAGASRCTHGAVCSLVTGAAWRILRRAGLHVRVRAAGSTVSIPGVRVHAAATELLGVAESRGMDADNVPYLYAITAHPPENFNYFRTAHP